MPKGIYERRWTLADRFWRHVEPEPNSCCWLWRGGLIGNGYGRFRRGPAHIRGRALAHRVAWELTRGPIPAGLAVCHRCDTPRCCNPYHLFLGTVADNNRDMCQKGRARYLRGSKIPCAKLSETLIPTIRHRYAAGEFITRIARDFGVSHQTIRAVVRRERWAHV